MRSLIIFIVSCGLAWSACGDKKGPEGGGQGGGSNAPAPAGGGFTRESAQKVLSGVKLGDGWEVGLSKAESDGFVSSWRGPANAEGARPNVMASGLSCMMGLCAELSADAWRKNSDNLKNKLSAEVKASPDLVFEVNEVTVEGKKAIAVYTLGYVEKKSDSGTSRMSSHSYDLYWHDGQKLVTVMTSAGSTGATSKAELATKMPRAELEATGQKVLAAIFANL